MLLVHSFIHSTLSYTDQLLIFIDDTENSNKSYSGSVSREQINSLLKASSDFSGQWVKPTYHVMVQDSSELSKLLKSWDVQRVREERATTWTTEDRLRKSAQDLLDTERDYVRVS